MIEALSFSRNQGGETSRNLFENLINFVLTDTSDLIRASRVNDFISLPLNDKEEVWFNDYLKEGKGRTLLGANDTVIMRGLLRGNEKPLLEHDSTDSGKIDGVNWTTFKQNTRQFSSYTVA